LIVVGSTLSVMAFVMLGAIHHEPIPVAPSMTRPATYDPATATAPSTPQAIVANSYGSHHHALEAKASPSPGSTSLRPSGGEFTADYQSGAVIAGHWTEGPIAGIEVEEPQSADPAPDPTPLAVSDMPLATHIAIAAVGIDTSIVEVTPEKTQFEGRAVFTWAVADWAAGHHITSADPGEGGNIILSGHDDVRGEVFRGLHDISLGDQVQLTSPAGVFTYVVAEIHVREYRDAAPEELIAAGNFLSPMPEERVTLVTCWPYGIDTHRIIVVAKPIEPRMYRHPAAAESIFESPRMGKMTNDSSPSSSLAGAEAYIS
jgi:sortase A